MSESCRWSSPTHVLTCKLHIRIVNLHAVSGLLVKFDILYDVFWLRALQLAPKSLPNHHHSICYSCRLYCLLVMEGRGSRMFLSGNSTVILSCCKRDFSGSSRWLNHMLSHDNGMCKYVIFTTCGLSCYSYSVTWTIHQSAWRHGIKRLKSGYMAVLCTASFTPRWCENS